MNFNLIPYDTEAYLIAADYAEEQGKLLTNAIRKKILPLDRENSKGEGCENNNCYNSENCYGNGLSGNGYGHTEGSGILYFRTRRISHGFGNGYGDGDGDGSGFFNF